MLGFDVVTLSVPAALVLGLAFGAGPCNLTCLSYLGPVFVGSNETARDAWRSVIPFSAGRLTGYSGLGLAAGLLGSSLKSWFQSPVVGWLLGGATILVGLSLLLRKRRKPQPWSHATVVIQPASVIAQKSPAEIPARIIPGGLFMMGAGMVLNPCAPLGTVLIAASASGSAGAGLGLGLGFGAGAVLIPALIFGVGVAHFGRELRLHMARWRPGLEIAACVLLIFMGVSTALGWVRP